MRKSTLLKLIASVRTWDTATRAALLLALGLLLAAGALGAAFAEWRQAALVAIGGLIVVVQGIFLWGNRRMVTPFTHAQRLYLAGDLEGALRVLEGARAAGHADVRTLTLLGNTYRQLGRLAESEAALRQALDKDSLHHFPLFGFGRTLLVEGRYADAVGVFECALEAGAPPITRLELAEAYYRMGDHTRTQALLAAVPLPVDADEAHRTLLAAYLRWRLGVGGRPTAAQVRAGLPFWERAAQLYAPTPYGAALAEDVREMHRLTQEESL